MVVFALNANFLNRAPVLQALCIVKQAWSAMEMPITVNNLPSLIPYRAVLHRIFILDSDLKPPYLNLLIKIIKTSSRF
jgi:hypothetical protein